ncbi:hypothetical protein ACF8SB_18420 [Pseudomonas sp. CJQ_8]|uniref:hypothetical protein n=1 Tax=Pseudomonas sp. CJQ_8 TaxID=3367167 RepID=UPI00370B3449
MQLLEPWGADLVPLDDLHSKIQIYEDVIPMPTENRSSNTEMVSVPREDIEAACARFAKAQIFDFSRRMRALLDHPAPQPNPEPIAWMVGTAFWWTKEEAERDAAATGKPMTPFGPMTGTYTPAEQHQGEPVAPAFVMPSCENSYGFGYVDGTCIQSLRGYRDHLEEIVDSIPEGPLYTHADPGEVERLRADLATVKADRDAYAQNAIDLRGQLAEAQEQLRAQDDLLSEAYQHDIGTPLKRKIRDAALSASAEPSAPVDLETSRLSG